MFLDVFRGGPLDGEQRPSGGASAAYDALVHTDGSLYTRDPERDAQGVVAWRHLERHEALAVQPQSNGIALERTTGMNLLELEEFAAAARANGFKDETPLHALIRFNGRLKRLYIQP